MKFRKNGLSSCFITVLILSAILCLCIITIYIYFELSGGPLNSVSVTETSEFGSQPIPDVDGFVETSLPEIENDDFNTQVLLDKTTVPINDPAGLASKYRGIKNIPLQLSIPPTLYSNGDKKKFWVLDVDDNSYRSVDAVLEYQTPHVYFWAENEIDIKFADLKKLVDFFEKHIYPTNRALFGSEWSPGIDNDLHLSILYAHNLGGAAGYFSSSDTLMREVEKYSNVAEMFYLSADYIQLDKSFARGVLAHEYQHMIHWNVDRNESSWINEGLSELAVEINGLGTGGFSHLFANNPDLQLNFWPGNDQGDSTPHYGASYLFMKYLFDRFGEGFISDLIAQSENGLKGLDKTLSSLDVNTQTKLLNSEQIFQDWTIANILQTSLKGDGIYSYGKGSEIPSFVPPRPIVCGSDPDIFTVNQFATDYYTISCDGDYEIEVKWNKNNKLNSNSPYSGKFYYWSNIGDESDMKLSRGFDLTNVEGHAELSFVTWFDIERDYDYVYINASNDGLNWDNLEPQNCQKKDPTGSNLGCGYNGMSNGWIRETVDLSKYVGSKIILEFEYVTDAAVNGEGFFLDDVTLEAIGYFDDFEKEDDDWFSEGFVRIQNIIPQVMGITVVDSINDLNIEKYIINENAKFTKKIEQKYLDDSGILIISGLSRYTHIPAEYQITVNRLDR